MLAHAQHSAFLSTIFHPSIRSNAFFIEIKMNERWESFPRKQLFYDFSWSCATSCFYRFDGFFFIIAPALDLEEKRQTNRRNGGWKGLWYRFAHNYRVHFRRNAQHGGGVCHTSLTRVVFFFGRLIIGIIIWLYDFFCALHFKAGSLSKLKIIFPDMWILLSMGTPKDLCMESRKVQWSMPW